MRADRLRSQLEALPAMHAQLLVAVVDREDRGLEEVTRGRGRSASRGAVERPVEANLTVLDFLAEPTIDGHLGFTRSLLALATVTRAALGGVAPASMEAQAIGLRELQRRGLDRRLEDAMRAEAIVEASHAAAAVRYLVAQADRIVSAEHWTAAAAAHVSAMYDEATVGLDEQILAAFTAWRDGSRARLEDADELDPAEALGLAVAGYATSRSEYVGLHLDSIRRWYAAAAAGGEQWADFVCEEIYRLHGRAEYLLGQVEQRSIPVDAAPCPYCDRHSLVVLVVPPSAACRRRTADAVARGERPPADRCCGEFVRCATCSKQLSMAVDPESGRCEASIVFAAFRGAGWVPRPRPADDGPTLAYTAAAR